MVGFSGQYALAARLVQAKLTTLEWIRVADPTAGVADDFQFLAGGTRYALQVKWAQYPGTFGWSELVGSPPQTEPLLRRLAVAWGRIREEWAGPLEIRLWSNENASARVAGGASPLNAAPAGAPRSFSSFLSRSYWPVREVVRARLRAWSELEPLPEFSDWLPVWDALREVSGLDPDTFVRFVSNFDMQFGAALEDPMLRRDAAARDVDLRHLAMTLQELVADPARPIQLARDELLTRLGWADRTRFRNPHVFPVPSIYAANETARAALMELLDRLPGGYIALVGPAGSGKSTLLSSLTWGDRRLVRYYAFVPDSPDPLSGRGEAESFLHDVSLALEEAGVYRDGTGNDLRTQRSVLLAQLDRAGEQFRDSGQETVIVVDGLDHIPREQNPTRSLLDELPPPAALPHGVYLVLGTQTVAVLPQAIREYLAAESRNIELPPLSRHEVVTLCDASGVGAWLLPGQVDSLVVASEGHPLALTYLLEELAALSHDEPNLERRRNVADGLLEDASAYGREVAARYRGYLRAAGDDRPLRELLAAVARLRVPVDLEWLKTWVPAPVMDDFVLRTAIFFRREGVAWRFIHNSFRRFLVDETSKVGGQVDPELDRALHVRLAEICHDSPDDWVLYRDQELAHRFLARDYANVIQIATPSKLRDKLTDLRPVDAVRTLSHLALRAAAETDDYPAFVRMLLFHNELSQREYVISAEKLAEAVCRIRPAAHVLDHVVVGGRLRISVDAALRIAKRFARKRDFGAASEILRAAGRLSEIVEDKPRAAPDWSEVTYRLSGLSEVLARVDAELRAGVSENSDRDSEADESHDWQAEQSRFRKQAARDQIMARCFDLAVETRDENALSILRGRIDTESASGWRARARLVDALAAQQDGEPGTVLARASEIVELHVGAAGDEYDEYDDDTEGREEVGGVPLGLRIAAAQAVMASGIENPEMLNQLVPDESEAAWPSVPSGSSGLDPFAAFIDLARWRMIATGVDADWGVPNSSTGGRDAGAERFRRALKAMAALEGRHFLARLGRSPEPDVVAGSTPIVRLVEVSERQARDWTIWYAVRDAAEGLYRRLFGLAEAVSSEAIEQIVGEFFTAWDDPDRGIYWRLWHKRKVLLAIDPVVARHLGLSMRERVELLDEEIEKWGAGPHDLAEAWLDQTRIWAAIGDLTRAERAVQNAVVNAWSPGIHDDDTQLSSWVGWMRAAADGGVLTGEQLINAALKYASRLRSVSDPGRDAAEAARQLVQLLWPIAPSISASTAESLCEAEILGEDDAICSVLLGASRDQGVPEGLVARAIADMHMPLQLASSEVFRTALLERGAALSAGVTSMLERADQLWAVPDVAGARPVEQPALLDDPAAGTSADTENDDHARGDEDADAVLGSFAEVVPERVPSVTALLGRLRGVTQAAPGAWDSAVRSVSGESITLDVAEALLGEASRLRLDGESLGTIAALAAKAGAAGLAADLMRDELARTRAAGWLRYIDGGSRVKLFASALQFRDSVLARLAAVDLAGAVASGALLGPFPPDDLRRIVTTVAGPDAVAAAWSEVDDYLDIFAPATEPTDGGTADRIGNPVAALLNWTAGYLGHPLRPRDFGARRVFQEGLLEANALTQAELGKLVLRGDWRAEAALQSILTTTRGAEALTSDLSESIVGATAAEDGIIRGLARKLCSRYGLTPISVDPIALPESYGLSLPPLPRRVPPEVDADGVPYIDLNDPQQVVAPFDLAIRIAGEASGISAEAVLHRASTFASGLTEPWLGRDQRAHADRLRRRGARHTYRPWALMAGRRALGRVLAELEDARVLALGSDPVQQLGLVDEKLTSVTPEPMDGTTPPPWRSPDSHNYDTRGWCDETEGAVDTYRAALSSEVAHILAESTEWVDLAWGTPKEERQVTAVAGPRLTPNLLLPMRREWDFSLYPATDYPDLMDLEWSNRELVVRGNERASDSPMLGWLALHPAVGAVLGWVVDDQELFRWSGRDGNWRARSVYRVRGQLSHHPPRAAFCAEGWQVLLSEQGVDELQQAFGAVRRWLTVRRTLRANARDGRPDEQTRVSRVELGGL